MAFYCIVHVNNDFRFRLLSRQVQNKKDFNPDYTDEEIDQLFDQWEVKLQTNPGHAKPDIDFLKRC